MAGWRAEVEVQAFLPDMTVAHAIAAREGRPEVDALGMDGVALAGDWIGPDGMLADAAVASGLRAAEAVQRNRHQASTRWTAISNSKTLDLSYSRWPTVCWEQALTGKMGCKMLICVGNRWR